MTLDVRLHLLVWLHKQPEAIDADPLRKMACAFA